MALALATTAAAAAPAERATVTKFSARTKPGGAGRRAANNTATTATKAQRWSRSRSKRETRAQAASAPATSAGSLMDEPATPKGDVPQTPPGVTDAAAFDCQPSVTLWRDWSFPSEPEEQATAVAQELASIGTEVAAAPSDTAYWGYHILRSTFFASLGVAGITASNLQGGDGASPLGRRGTELGSAAGRLYCEALEMFRQDLAFIKQGLFNPPLDMDVSHRQFDPAYVLDKTRRFIDESVGTLARRDQGADTSVWIAENDDFYPEYYRHTFHYQKDGWFSQDSAKVYETSTETLFVGRQDAMQRTTLVPVARHLKQTGGAAGKRCLELACGTGRVGCFSRDSFPEMEHVLLDLSPFYLSEARENHSYLEELKPETSFAPVRFVHANAEYVPELSDSFDVVTSVYLFHELPPEARRNVFREAFRVLKPGGLFVVTDSLQYGDRPSQDPFIGNFADFAEPYYMSYLAEDFAAMGVSVGFEPWQKEQASASKTLSFRKPIE